MNFTLDFDKKPKSAEIDLIQKGLDHFNATILKEQPKEFGIYLRDTSHEIHGGILALSYTDSLHIILLWVDNKIRSQGYGTKLLKAAEQEAIRRNCRYVFVDTFGFQGEKFYLKNEYQCIGKIENVLRNHPKVFFRKNLSA